MHSYSRNLQTLLAHKVNRKDFLRYVGLLILAFVGIAGLMKRFEDLFRKPVQTGYGSTTYGGV